ncbi:987_t:CDS:1, partial [Ambispora gerdemannii]
KHARLAQEAIRKRWKQAESSEPSDAKPDKYNECFSTFWIEGEENCLDSDEIMDQLQALQPNVLEQLVENAKSQMYGLQTHVDQYIRELHNRYCATREHIGKRQFQVLKRSLICF